MDTVSGEQPDHGLPKAAVDVFQMAADDILDSFNAYLGKRKAERDRSFRESDDAFAHVGDGLYVNRSGVFSFAICIPYWRGVERMAPPSPIRARFAVGKYELIQFPGWLFDGPASAGTEHSMTTLDLVLWFPEEESADEKHVTMRVEGAKYGLPAWPLSETGPSHDVAAFYERVIARLEDSTKKALAALAK